MIDNTIIVSCYKKARAYGDWYLWWDGTTDSWTTGQLAKTPDGDVFYLCSGETTDAEWAADRGFKIFNYLVV